MGTQFNHEQILEFSSDDKYYCWNHKKIVIKNNKKMKADKVKEEKLKLKEAAKQKANEEKAKLKEELKKSVQLAKMNKKTKPIINNNLENENVVIGSNEAKDIVETSNNILLCQVILKSGKNKGSPCGDKIFENNLCKRHHKKTCG